MILIDFTYMNQSGGKVLLLELLSNMKRLQMNLLIILDKRLKLDSNAVNTNWKIYYVEGNELQRSFLLLRLHKEYSLERILYFNGIPPIFKSSKVKTFAYFQNTTILNNKLKKLYFKFFHKNVDLWICQTNKTKEQFLKTFKAKVVLVRPIFPSQSSNKENMIKGDSKYFFYPTSNHKHKNNRRLIEAFQLLHERGYDSELHITLDNMDSYGKTSNNIKFIGSLNKEEVLKKYIDGCTVIHPSLEESFGLVLVEACQFKLNILASNLPYVHEIIQPSETFDPLDKNDIAHKVEKYIQNKYVAPTPRLKIENEIDQLINLITE